MAPRKSGAAAPRRRSSAPAKIAPASVQEASGAVIEPSVAKLPDHPSVDRNPREGTTVDQNRADFNDPSGLTPPEDQVVEHLKSGE
jgi:hypothetical protein